MDYINILKKELIPALGCTEPIAIAFASAKASEVLGKKPSKIYANLSANIIKNANSVKVPGTNGRKGIEISIVSGALLGDSDKNLEVLNGIDKSRLKECDQFIDEGRVEVSLAQGKANLYIEIYAQKDGENARVIVANKHTEIVKIEKNNELIFEEKCQDKAEKSSSFSFDSDRKSVV